MNDEENGQGQVPKAARFRAVEKLIDFLRDPPSAARDSSEDVPDEEKVLMTSTGQMSKALRFELVDKLADFLLYPPSGARVSGTVRFRVVEKLTDFLLDPPSAARFWRPQDLHHVLLELPPTITEVLLKRQ